MKMKHARAFCRFLGWCGSLIAASAIAQTDVETFEYPDSDTLLAYWQTSANAMVSVSTDISPESSGETCMQVDFQFPSTAWATEWVRGPQLGDFVAIGSEQYLSFRVKGDPAFAAADFRNLYLYVYDDAGYFGRWGTAIPTSADWQVVNFSASAIEQPWDSPGLPDLSRIVQFAFFQYGSEAELEPYAATIFLDDLSIRDTPLSGGEPPAEAVVETFEYPSEDDLLAAWFPSLNAVLALSDSVAPASDGERSLQVTFSFPSIEWATETIRGPDLPEPMSIGQGQYLTFRIRSDPAFAAADFRNLYLYAYDVNGNFGRWGAAVPVTDEWQVMNFAAASMEQPWDSPALPDLSQIVRFAFFQYGSQAAIEPYTATIYLDDLQVRNSPLTEFPPPSAPRELIDDFEQYGDTGALMAFYGYQVSPVATVTTAEIESPAPQGAKALKLAIDFAPGQYPWGSVRSPAVAPFSLSENAVVSLRFRGDPSLAEVADAGTSFWLSFFDEAGGGIHFISPAEVVTSGEWTTLQATLDDFTDSSTVDVGNLVQWRVLVQAWEGTPDHTGTTGVFLVDDIRISAPSGEQPALSLVRDAGELVLNAARLAPGTAYELSMSTNLVDWTEVEVIQATSTTATWNITPDRPAAFYQIIQNQP